jgi:hypothetical protein
MAFLWSGCSVSSLGWKPLEKESVEMRLTNPISYLFVQIMRFGSAKCSCSVGKKNRNDDDDANGKAAAVGVRKTSHFRASSAEMGEKVYTGKLYFLVFFSILFIVSSSSLSMLALEPFFVCCVQFL